MSTQVGPETSMFSHFLAAMGDRQRSCRTSWLVGGGGGGGSASTLPWSSAVFVQLHRVDLSPAEEVLAKAVVCI